MYIDSHTHISSEYYENIDKIIENSVNNNVKYLIVSCCSKKSIEEGIELIKKYNNIFLTIGLHPDEANYYCDKDIQYIKKIASTYDKVVGIGEIGLDYHYEKETKNKQKELFEKQLALAEELKMPVVIHTREATLDTINILKKYNVKGVIHCFSGSVETLQEYLKLGYSIGIGGVVTFKNSNLGKTIKDVELEKILLETDSPYLSPEPFRGKTNESKNIPIIAKKISEIKNKSLKDVETQTVKNTMELFNLHEFINELT